MSTFNQLNKILLIINKFIEYDDIKNQKTLIYIISRLINSLDYIYFQNTDICYALYENKDATFPNCCKTCNNTYECYDCYLECDLVEINHISMPIGYMYDIIWEILTISYDKYDLNQLDKYAILKLFNISDKLYIDEYEGINAYISDNKVNMINTLKISAYKYLVSMVWNIDYLNAFLKAFLDYNKVNIDNDTVLKRLGNNTYQIYDIDIKKYRIVDKGILMSLIFDLIWNMDTIDDIVYLYNDILTVRWL